MNGTEIFIDTNICIYLLNGDSVLAELLQDQNIYISVITEIELSAYHSDNPVALKILKTFLEVVTIIDLDEKVKINAIKIRKNRKIKLPDSIIAASALSHKLPIITADKGFKNIANIDLVFYEKE